MKAGLIDKKKLLSVYQDIGFDVLSDIIDDFFDFGHSYLENVVKCLSEKDYQNLRIHAHSMKGAFAAFYADEMVRIANLIEQEAKRNNDSNVIDDGIIGDLTEKILQFNSELKNIKLEL